MKTMNTNGHQRKQSMKINGHYRTTNEHQRNSANESQRTQMNTNEKQITLNKNRSK